MMTKFINIFILIIIVVGCTKKSSLKQSYLEPFRNSSDDALALVFTSNMEGYIEPCGCTSDPLGGIDRFSTLINQVGILINKPLIIDTGNLFFEKNISNQADACQNDAKIDMLLKSLSYFNIKFSTMYKLDNSQGLKYYTDKMAKNNLPVLTSSSLIVQEEITHQKQKVIFLSLTKDFVNLDEINLLKEQIAKNKAKNPQILVFISHLTLDNTNQYLGNNKDLDIIIQANWHDMTPMTPVKINKDGPLIVSSGRQGQYFTSLIIQNFKNKANNRFIFDSQIYELMEQKELLTSRIQGLETQLKNATNKDFLQKRLQIAKKDLEIANKKTIIPIKNAVISFASLPINRNIEPDKNIKKYLDSYSENLASIVKKCEEKLVCPQAKENEATYVGAQTCKACHQEAYDVWQKAKFIVEAKDENNAIIKREIGHAKAWQTLIDAKSDNDRSCIGCHSIGFMQPGGYCKSTEVDFRKDVQCESCHGPGSLHAKSGKKQDIIGKVDEQTCRNCHHVPHIKSFESFNFERDVVKVLGKGHGEKLLQQLNHKNTNNNQ